MNKQQWETTNLKHRAIFLFPFSHFATNTIFHTYVFPSSRSLYLGKLLFLLLLLLIYLLHKLLLLIPLCLLIQHCLGFGDNLSQWSNRGVILNTFEFHEVIFGAMNIGRKTALLEKTLAEFTVLTNLTNIKYYSQTYAIAI